MNGHDQPKMSYWKRYRQEFASGAVPWFRDNIVLAVLMLVAPPLIALWQNQSGIDWATVKTTLYIYAAVAIIYILIHAIVTPAKIDKAREREVTELSEKNREERERSASLTAQLNDARPSLVAEILQTIVAEVAGSSIAHINMSVLNRGSQSFARHWNISANVNGRIHAGQLETIANPTELQVGTGSVRLTPEDGIYEKTTNPIQRGAIQTGWIRCSIPGIPRSVLTMRGVEWKVEFEDYLGNRISATHVFGSGPMLAPQYFPDGKGPRSGAYLNANG